MQELNSSWRDVAKINLMIAYGCFLIFVGYVVYPTDPHWWAFGFLSICCFLSAAGLIGKAISAALKLRQNDAVRDDMLTRPAPHNAKLASREDLEKAGML
ncbi:hypothetical protein [Pararhizobium sp. IMCC21322]|uniref:hypothetical protein n=1 Tax=Pararhizobium sp. IMCC21322 TaxID=3067903 RepID=UPI0027412DB1|nr:hypothetical protein [Pararhizobium sp. IMCC21322]